MDTFFGFLLSLEPYLHILTVIILITKAILVFKRKGISVPAYILSFFRIYTKVEMITTVRRYQFMKMNNLINYYLYSWIILVVIMLIVAGTLY